MNISSFRKYTQLWYSGYAFQGIVVFGTGAILMPIIVNSAGDAAKAGMVMGFFYIGQLLAPLMGTITDRTGLAVIRDEYSLKKKAAVEFTMNRWLTGQVILSEAIKLLTCAA